MQMNKNGEIILKKRTPEEREFHYVEKITLLQTRLRDLNRKLHQPECPHKDDPIEFSSCCQNPWVSLKEFEKNAKWKAPGLNQPEEADFCACKYDAGEKGWVYRFNYYAGGDWFSQSGEEDSVPNYYKVLTHN